MDGREQALRFATAGPGQAPLRIAASGTGQAPLRMPGMRYKQEGQARASPRIRIAIGFLAWLPTVASDRGS